MDKDFEKLIKSLMKDVKEFTNSFGKIVEDATGKDLDELMEMPTETDEEKKAFLKEIKKIKDKLDEITDKKENDVHDFSEEFIKIKGGKTYTSFEAKGNPVDLLHMLAQGVATIMYKNGKNKPFSDKDFEEFSKMYMDEVKSIYDHTD